MRVAVEKLTRIPTYATQMGNEAMTMGLEWTKKDEFRHEPLHVWTIKGNQIAGLTRSGGGLTFATIVGAGHMVRAPCLSSAW